MSRESAKPRVAVLIPVPMRGNILSPDAERDLASFAEVASASAPDDVTGALDGAVACVTGWGTKPLTEEIVQGASSLKLVAHTAGSIHKLVAPASMERGLRVTHAAAIIADSVAEIVIGQALRFLRHLDDIDREMKAGGEWLEIRETYPGRLLGERVVGIIGAGHVGRTVIQRFKAFGCRMLVSDPFLSVERASELGVERTEIDEIFQTCDIVSLHAPALPETEGMVGAEQLRMLRDGGLLINMSRGSLVQEDALVDELRRQRIYAILDVYAQEPLPVDSPIRSLPNVFLSPHAAGHTIDTHFRQGQAMVDEVRRLIEGESLKYEIAVAMLATMA